MVKSSLLLKSTRPDKLMFSISLILVVNFYHYIIIFNVNLEFILLLLEISWEYRSTRCCKFTLFLAHFVQSGFFSPHSDLFRLVTRWKRGWKKVSLSYIWETIERTLMCGSTFVQWQWKKSKKKYSKWATGIFFQKVFRQMVKVAWDVLNSRLRFFRSYKIN